MIGKLIGLILLAAGFYLVYMGYISASSIKDQLLSLTSGKLSQQTMIYYGGGAACLVVGFLTFFSSKPD